MSDVEVLVIGGGPVGMSAALELARLGVPAMLVERRSVTSQHPKAQGIHPRTMELLDQWGVTGELRASGIPPHRGLGFAWMTRLNGLEFGNVMLSDEPERLAEFSRASPQTICFVAQNHVERALHRALTDTPRVTLAMGTAVTHIDQDSDQVTVTLREAAGERTVTAQYVIAADGAHSLTRTALGITESCIPSLGDTVAVYVHSPQLTALAGDRPYLIWWVVSPDVSGVFWPTDNDDNWIFSFDGDPALGDEHYDEELCLSLLRAGAGVPGLEVAIIKILRWEHDAAVADRWRQGRVFLAGDAAHRFPPHGGFGMNSGIQDISNLCWKLAAVTSGQAGAGLLDSYETERRPVAQLNAQQAMTNTETMGEVGWLLRDPELVADIERPEGAEIRRKFAEAVPRQRRMLWSQGQQFGFVYEESNATVDDGTQVERSTISEYVPSGHPGARAPHLWLMADGEDRVSPITLERSGFILLCGSQGRAWRTAGKVAAGRLGVPIAVYVIGVDLVPVDESFEDLYGIEPNGAVLVRPDGIIGMRARSLPDNPPEVLRSAVAKILDRE